MAETNPLCPICKRAPSNSDARIRPFCSPRCKDIDLHNWFSGAYRIPERAVPVDEELSPADQADSVPDDDIA